MKNTSLRTILENLVHEDDDARRKGWKHIAFGTWEDPSGNRFKKDNAGQWQPIGGAGNSTASTSTVQTTPVTPMVDRDKIATVKDERERAFLTVMADIAELPDDSDFVDAMMDDRFSDIAKEFLNDAATQKWQSGDALEQLQRVIKDIAADTGYDADDVAQKITTREIGWDAHDDLVPAMRDAIAGRVKESIPDEPSTNAHDDYERRVRELEDEGMDRSDAQGITDLEFDQRLGKGWERTSLKELLRLS